MSKKLKINFHQDWWESEQPVHKLQKRVVFSEIDEFFDFVDGPAASGRVQELLNDWLSNPQNEANKKEVADVVYVTTAIMNFMCALDSKWGKLKYLTVRDKKEEGGIES